MKHFLRFDSSRDTLLPKLLSGELRAEGTRGGRGSRGDAENAEACGMKWRNRHGGDV
jgi:hypothetical protein